MIGQNNKEKCSHCNKFINIGQPVIECTSCNIVIHGKCLRSSSFVALNGGNYCNLCCTAIEKRYNPFKSACALADEGDDDLPDDTYTELIKISSMLESCKSYDVANFNKLEESVFSKHVSLYFLNIDGNRTNFDQLILELQRYKHGPSIIGIAETNISPTVSEVYQIPGYYSF